MIFKLMYMYFFGVVEIIVEGFFIERFINICKANNILLLSLKIEKGTVLKAKINKSDFKKIRHIAKKTGCKVELRSKKGLPFIIRKYRKRKVFAIALLVIAIFCFISTRFIWNVEVSGIENISKEEILSNLAEYGIKKGKLKSGLDIEKIKNEIRLNRNDLAWIGIDINGTNAIITIVEAIKEPEIIDENIQSNIIADRGGIISKMVVRSGTARVNVGDEVSPGDLLVEGIMEGKYTEPRYVNSDADIYSVSTYEKERKESFIQRIQEKTGNIEKNVEIYIKNFKIFFNKGVPKFEKCDTIKTNKRVKLFSKYYIPIEIVEITNFELQENYKTYTEQTLSEKITNELQEELMQELQLTNLDNVKQTTDFVIDVDGITAKVIYEIEEKIGTKE